MVSVSGPDESWVGQWRAVLALALREAMKRRDTVAVAALRSLSARIANAEAVPADTMPRAGAVEATALGVGAADAERRVLTEAEVEALVAAELAEIEEGVRSLASAGQEATARDLAARGEVIRAFRHP